MEASAGARRVLWFVDSPGHGGSEINLLRVIQMLQGECESVLVHSPRAPAWWVARVRDAGAQCVEWASTPNAAPHAAVGLVRALAALRHLQGLVVVWAHHPDSNRWLQCALALGGRPFMVVEQLVPANAEVLRASRLSAPIKRLVIRRAQHVIVNARSQVEHYQGLYQARGRVCAISNSRRVADIARRADAMRKGVKCGSAGEAGRGGPVIACVARLVIEKGQRDLVVAMSRVRRHFPGAVVRLVGEGAERGPVERLAQELGVEVVFCGQVADVLPLLADAEVFVLPSWVEGLPGALIEAMAAGVPCVATDIPGNRDLVVHNATGLLVPVRNPTALGNAIVGLLANKDWASELARKARARVQEEYEEGNERERWRALMNEVLARPG